MSYTIIGNTNTVQEPVAIKEEPIDDFSRIDDEPAQKQITLPTIIVQDRLQNGPSKMIQISMNKPNSNEPLILQPIEFPRIEDEFNIPVQRLIKLPANKTFTAPPPKPATLNDPFAVPPSKILKISLNKPNLNEPLVVQPKFEKRHYYYRPRAPASWVVNSLFPMSRPVRKDCCHKCKLIFNHTLDYLLHKYQKHQKLDRIPRSRYQSCSNCTKKFFSKKALLNHSFVCAFRFYRYFVCSGCSQTFNDYLTCKRHEMRCYIRFLKS